MHIGDAHSRGYTYYKQLISAIKPDIIVYTGDTADEVKVGGYPELKDEYIEKVQSFIGALERPDCKSYWVPGNNDLPGEIAKIAPFLMPILAKAPPICKSESQILQEIMQTNRRDRCPVPAV